MNFDPLTVDEINATNAPSAEARAVQALPAPPAAFPIKYSHPELGLPTDTWAYHNAEGKVIGAVARFETNGRKEYRPLVYCKEKGRCGWRSRGFPKPRPLYRLPQLLKTTRPILIVEGEKSADAAAKRFPDHEVTTPPQGAQSPAHAEWSTLSGRHVLVWPDNDDPGQAFATKVSGLVQEAGAASVRIVKLPIGLPEKWDLADPIPEGMSEKDLCDCLAEAQPIKPLPLTREAAAAAEFPVQALGPHMSLAALAIHQKVKAPLALCCQSVLAVAALAAQSQANVRLPSGQDRPLSLFLVSVAGSGERKTSADIEALKSIDEQEKFLQEKYELDQDEYLIANEVWESAKKKIVRNEKLSQEERRSKLEELGKAPKPPLTPHLTCGEGSYEGVVKLLIGNEPSIGLFSNEGGAFTSGYGMNDENRIRMAAGLSKFWDGQKIKRTFAGDGTTALSGRRLSLHLMLQPDLASEFMNDRRLEDQGLHSRILIAAPDSLVGRRLQGEFDPQWDNNIKAFAHRINHVFDQGYRVIDGTQNELDLRTIPLDQKAQRIWSEWADVIELDMGINGSLEPIRSFASKLPEHAARLAGVLAIIEDPRADHISSDQMERGIGLAEFYAEESLRLNGQAQVDADLVLAESLLEWLHRNWCQNVVSLPDIYQTGPNRIRSMATAKRIVAILEQHGHLVHLVEGAVVNGTHRRNAWRVMGE